MQSRIRRRRRSTRRLSVHRRTSATPGEDLYATQSSWSVRLPAAYAEIARHASRWTRRLLLPKCKIRRFSYSTGFLSRILDHRILWHAGSQDTDLSCMLYTYLHFLLHFMISIQSSNNITDIQTDGQRDVMLVACRAKNRVFKLNDNFRFILAVIVVLF